MTNSHDFIDSLDLAAGDSDAAQNNARSLEPFKQLQVIATVRVFDGNCTKNDTCT